MSSTRKTRTLTDDERRVVRLAHDYYRVPQDQIAREAGLVTAAGRTADRQIRYWLAGKNGSKGAMDAVVRVACSVVLGRKTGSGGARIALPSLVALALRTHEERVAAGSAPKQRPQSRARAATAL